jgi:nucleoside-diphosphate-sugar epimerase
MIVAITGATGFIGSNLCRRFAEAGWLVRPVTRADFEQKRVAPLLRGADVVVHSAGATRAPSRRMLDESNVELTRHVLDAAHQGGVRRFVLLSSQAAAGPARSRSQPVLETDAPLPIDAYGRSKLAAERIVAAATAMRPVILRLGAVYGPGDRDFAPLFRLAYRGVAVHPGNRNKWIEILHVDDAARAILLSAASVVGGTFFIVGPAPVQWGQLFALAAKAAGTSLRLEVEVPTPLVKLGARAGDLVARLTGRTGLLTSEKVRLAEPCYWLCSSLRAQEELHFLAGVELRDGLASTFRWYRDAGWM